MRVSETSPLALFGKYFPQARDIFRWNLIFQVTTSVMNVLRILNLSFRRVGNSCPSGSYVQRRVRRRLAGTPAGLSIVCAVIEGGCSLEAVAALSGEANLRCTRSNF